MAMVTTVGCVAPLVRRYVALPADSGADCLGFALKWLLAPARTLLAGILVAARRGFIADAIEDPRLPSNYALEISPRYNQNFIEQTVLAIVASTALRSRCRARGWCWCPSWPDNSVSATTRFGSVTCCIRSDGRSAWC